MPTKPQICTTPLRLPSDLKTWIKQHAAVNERSVNAQIIAMLLEEKRKSEELQERR